jgi:hypothetical protein
MNGHQSIVISVSENVAKNKVAQAIERARLRKFFTDVSFEALHLADKAPASSLVLALTEAIGIACKSVEGYNDPAGVRDQLTGALGLMAGMSEDGFLWRAEHAQALVDAMDIAIQILSSADPEEKLKAWVWAQEVESEERAKAARKAAQATEAMA